MSIHKEQIRSALGYVIHPGYKKDLITLDLIQDLITQDKFVSFTLELPKKDDSLASKLKSDCTAAIQKYVDPDAVLDITVGINISRQRELEGEDSAQKPPQQPQPEPVLAGVKNVIAVASGKGGVGKSTVAANLAVALAQTGSRVGLLDTDIYGPSVPTMFGVTERPNVTTQKKLVPIEKHGVHLVSMGFLVDPDQAMIWRGPMVTSAVKQFMQEVAWGELDYLILDLPPGTGDIQLTIVQTVPLTGAVIVSTPQAVALDDVRKGVAMFQKVNVPVLGVIENMAYFVPDDQPEKKYYIFGKHGARQLAERLEVPFLGEVPLREQIRETSDSGTPVVAADPSSPSAIRLKEIANRIHQALALRNAEMQPTKKIDIKIRP
ncbi:MAG: MRP family ATP-binding protein [Balneolaceae bacterium]|nr:MAG: MRP family ATP-binding protein [Balneolaceae bacterium]